MVFIIGVYVDDILVTGSNIIVIKDFKEQMSRKFNMSDLEKLSYYLGIELEQGASYIELKQTSYAKKILEKAKMTKCNTTKYPTVPKEYINKDEGGMTVNATQFKSMI